MSDVVVSLRLPAAWPTSGWGDLASVVAQVPPATSLPGQSRVTVRGEAVREASTLGRLVGRDRVLVPRALISTALLAQGYVDVGAGPDPTAKGDRAWGTAPGAPAAEPR